MDLRDVCRVRLWTPGNARYKREGGNIINMIWQLMLVRMNPIGGSLFSRLGASWDEPAVMKSGLCAGGKDVRLVPDDLWFRFWWGFMVEGQVRS